MKKKLHTTKIVAQYLDLSERRVRQLRDEGVLEEKAPGLTGMTTIVMNLRSRLLALPNKLAANIAKLDGDEDKIMDLLQSSLREIMEEFSNYQVALERPKDDEDEQDGEKTG